VATHPETILANSGYMPDMKGGKKKPGSFYILGYLLELIAQIWRFEFSFSFRNLANLNNHFSHEMVSIS
jgi:hypothetical protein